MSVLVTSTRFPRKINSFGITWHPLSRFGQILILINIVMDKRTWAKTGLQILDIRLLLLLLTPPLFLDLISSKMRTNLYHNCSQTFHSTARNYIYLIWMRLKSRGISMYMWHGCAHCFNDHFPRDFPANAGRKSTLQEHSPSKFLSQRFRRLSLD